MKQLKIIISDVEYLELKARSAKEGKTLKAYILDNCIGAKALKYYEKDLKILLLLSRGENVSNWIFTILKHNESILADFERWRRSNLSTEFKSIVHLLNTFRKYYETSKGVKQ